MQPIVDFQKLLTGSHYPSDGSQVGGSSPNPTDPLFLAGLIVPIVDDGSRLFLVSGTNKKGSQYPDGEFFCTIPTTYTGGPLTVTWKPKILSDVTALWVLETTLIWVYKGMAYNAAFEINQQGHVLLSSFGEGWVDTGVNVGALVANVANTIAINLDFNPNIKVRAVLAVTVNGKTQAIPTKYQAAPATASTWENGVFVAQLQLGQTADGGLIAVELGPGCSIE